MVAARFDAVNRHALADIVAHYAPDATVTASDLCAPRRGHADVERIYRGIFASLPDAAADVQGYITDGDRVAVRYVVRGHFSGRAVAIPIMNFFTIKGGLIVRDDGLFDNGGRPCTP
ncbi:MAG: ester cyclase [Sphingomonadaceae bacterium]